MQEQVTSPAFKINDPLVKIKEVNSDSDIAIYPNSFSSKLNIILPENFNGDYIFKIIDLTGKTLYTRTQSDKSFVWDASSLAKGVYILSIENNEKSIFRRVISR